MSEAPSRNVRLYGTEQPAAAVRVLRAGALSVELEAGNLRHVRIDGVEAIRAVSFIVRDRDWGTYDPEISDLQVSETDEGFQVGYSASVNEADRQFEYRATLRGSAEQLVFEASGTSSTGFETNRTGFVVLHPIVGVAGAPVTIERVDGSIEHGAFPEAIDPLQPMMNLRALTHEPVPGVSVQCRMEGDTYEMEDQRNWTDASFKTYVRPLARPWPYELPAGQTLEQRVVLSISGRPSGTAGTDDEVRLAFAESGNAAPAMPGIGVAVDAADPAPGDPGVQALAELNPACALIRHDPRRGDDAASLLASSRLAERIGTVCRLEAVIAEIDGFAAELDALAADVAATGQPVQTVFVSPAADTRGTLPGSEWPPAPALGALYAQAGKAFPDARIGGGSFAHFTELNRKRPPVHALDTLCFTTSALVHAGDDATAMQNLEAVPAVVDTARSIAQGLPLSIGPSAIGMRINPYGDAPAENPDNVRQAMNRADPRQRGLFGAAWLVGYASAAAAHGVEMIVTGAATGARGLVHARGGDAAPWYDEQGGVYPQYHIVRTLACWQGRTRCPLACNRPSSVAVIGCHVEAGVDALVANLTASPVRVRLPGCATQVRTLDAATFENAASSPTLFDPIDDAEPVVDTLQLDAFAVVRLQLSAG